MSGVVVEPALIRERAVELRQRIAAAGADPSAITVVAVTKAFPVELARSAFEAGLTDLGENYAQELAAKVAAMGSAAAFAADPAVAGGPDGGPDDEAAPRWHFIGGLQRNKVKLLAGSVSLWQTVDRPALVDEIAKRSPADAVLIQVNTTDEVQKSGCEPAATASLVDRARAAGLSVRGLMTVGPTSPDTDPRPAFALLREVASSCEVDELSMGMSADYEQAIGEGSTMIRVGSALFGPRPSRPSQRTGGVGN